jgi:signal peptidase I
MEGLKRKLQRIEKRYGIVIYTILSILVLNIYAATNIMVYLLAVVGVFLLYHFKQESYLPYIFGGAFAALFLKFVLGILLSTSLPAVSVLSGSMVHDENTEINYYQWLERNMGYNRSYVNSWPIRNGFLVGDLPIVQGSDNYKVGDVIVYDVAGQSIPIIHRIIKINSDGTFMTKGDHNSDLLPFEYSVRRDQTQGKVIFIIPKLGYFKVIFSWFFGGS